jgi:tetratricopeptide (TPR) repeat protein
MIGRFNLEAPPIDDELSQMVESHRAQTGQGYDAILHFGLWGTVDCSAEVRLYAAYRHLAENPEDGPAWLETSRVHLEAGEADKAMAIVDELERLDTPGLYPNLYSEDPDVLRAHILADSGQLDAALDLFDSLRGRHGDAPAYHYAVGTVLQEQRDYAAAAAAFGEALEALEDFRREAEEEDVLDDLNVDFPAAKAFLEAAKQSAEAGRPFDGERPLDLSGFTVDLGEE